ncbi:MAG TPA: alpha/beta hydrolase [Candidatus Polarisedimenticolaceae bacterium]|nr:alpha/beta hydrolase [Candidatus Polarisedimenticolaceae bacterium]
MRGRWVVAVAGTLACLTAMAFEKKVDVGGFKLNLRCAGAGSPTVVLDAGAGDTSATWDWVVPEVKKFARVCAYDRAGLGKSAAGPKPRSAARISEELHNLLRRAGVLPPYVLAGHSAGGLNMRVYTAKYPEEVVGLVLVDATQEDFPQMEASILTPAEREKTRTAIANAPEAVRDEIEAIPQSVQELKRAGSPPAVPTAIITAFHETESDKFRKAWIELQDRLASTYPAAKRVLADKSGHYVPFDQPELVVDTIREIVEKAQKK